MILETAKRHFDEDLARAQSLKVHALAVAEPQLQGDVLRAAWMMAVGASDAFFCDAYADVVSRTLRAKEFQPGGILPDRLGGLRVPVVAILAGTGGWRWRMAARELIEKENVLSLEKIKALLNLFCRDTNKLMTEATIERWIQHPSAKQRMFGIDRYAYGRLASAAKGTARKKALKALEGRMSDIFQRRHDCIHNCDRPKAALKAMSEAMVNKTIQDVSFLVERCCEHLRSEFPLYLTARGFNGVTRNKVGA